MPIEVVMLEKEIGVVNEEDIEIYHLPLDQSVLKDVDSTAQATDIDAADITVENVELETNGSTKSIDFTLDGLSIVAVSTHPSIFGQTDQDTSQVNYSQALGRAVEYGIVADTYVQKNHQQTNFAVKDYKNEGQINGEPDLAGTHDVPYQIGKISQNKLRFGTSTYQSQAVQYDVYLPKSYESNINNYVQIDGGGRDTAEEQYTDTD